MIYKVYYYLSIVSILKLLLYSIEKFTNVNELLYKNMNKNLKTEKTNKRMLM